MDVLNLTILEYIQEQTSSWTGSTPTSQMEIVNFKPSIIDCNTKFKTERFIKYKIVITVGCYLER